MIVGCTTRIEDDPITLRASERPRVLLVEREKPIRDTVVPWLFEDGFDCREAEDGRDAIDLLATGLRIDLVLSCLLMPIVDGYTLLLHVKQHYPDIRFAIVTAVKDEQIQEAAAQNGADGYLVKPFSYEEFVTLVRGVLARPAKPAQGTPLPSRATSNKRV